MLRQLLPHSGSGGLLVAGLLIVCFSRVVGGLDRFKRTSALQLIPDVRAEVGFFGSAACASVLQDPGRTIGFLRIHIAENDLRQVVDQDLRLAQAQIAPNLTEGSHHRDAIMTGVRQDD